MKREKGNILNITDLTFEQLQNLVKFIYGDSIDDLEEKADEYLRVARSYKLPRLIRMCEILLYKKLNVQNSLKIFISVSDCESQDDVVQKHTLQYIDQ